MQQPTGAAPLVADRFGVDQLRGLGVGGGDEPATPSAADDPAVESAERVGVQLVGPAVRVEVEPVGFVVEVAVVRGEDRRPQLLRVVQVDAVEGVGAVEHAQHPVEHRGTEIGVDPVRQDAAGAVEAGQPGGQLDV